MTVTGQQLACLRLAAQGHSNDDIAKQLWISPSTVKGHLRLVRDLLGAQNTTHAVAIAVATGLITTEVGQEASLRVALTHIGNALGYDLALIPRDGA